MANGIDGNALVSSLYKNHSNLEKAADDANYVGGIHIGPFGIPNAFLLNALRTDSQKSAQEAPGQYMDAMTNFLQTLEKALDKAHGTR